MPVDEAAGCLVVIARACWAILEACSDFLFIDDMVRGFWWFCKALGRVVVLVVTLFQVWLADEYDVLAGIIGLVTLILITAGCIKLATSPPQHHKSVTERSQRATP